MVKIIYENKFDISFCVILLLPRDTELRLIFMTDAKYIVCLSFPGFQAKPNWVSKVYELWESQ